MWAQKYRLLDEGGRRPPNIAERRFVDGNPTPPRKAQRFGGTRRRNDAPALSGIVGVEKDHRQTNGAIAEAFGKDRGGNRHQHPGAVSGPGIGRQRPSMTDAAEGLERALNDPRRWAAAGICDEADSARVSLVDSSTAHGALPPIQNGARSRAPLLEAAV